jgi:hypothetical protein
MVAIVTDYQTKIWIKIAGKIYSWFLTTFVCIPCLKSCMVHTGHYRLWLPENGSKNSETTHMAIWKLNNINWGCNYVYTSTISNKINEQLLKMW